MSTTEEKAVPCVVTPVDEAVTCVTKNPILSANATVCYSITKSPNLSVESTTRRSKRQGELGYFSSSTKRSAVTKSFAKGSQSGWDEIGDVTEGLKEMIVISSSVLPG